MKEEDINNQYKFNKKVVMVNNKIIGYIHICQKGEWKRSFDIIFNSLQNSGLYDETSEIRCGILSDTGMIDYDER